MAAWDDGLFYGYFYNKSFVVRYERFPGTGSCKLIEWPCGGNHRIWKCLLANNQIQFAYLRKQNLFIESFNLSDLDCFLSVGMDKWQSKVIRKVELIIHPYFATVSDDGSLGLWNMSHQSLQQLTSGFHRSSINTVSFCSGVLFSGGGRSEIIAYDFMSTNELCFTAFYCHSKTKDNSLNEEVRVSAIESFECDEKSINLIFALTNGCVMFGSYDRFHKKFDESRFYEVKVYEYPNCYVTCMASDFKSKPKFIYFGLSNGVFVIFSIETKSVIYSKRIHKGTIVSVASTDDAIFSGGYDGNLYEIKLSQESLFQHKLVYSNLFPINANLHS